MGTRGKGIARGYYKGSWLLKRQQQSMMDGLEYLSSDRRDLTCHAKRAFTPELNKIHHQQLLSPPIMMFAKSTTLFALSVFSDLLALQYKDQNTPAGASSGFQSKNSLKIEPYISLFSRTSSFIPYCLASPHCPGGSRMPSSIQLGSLRKAMYSLCLSIFRIYSLSTSKVNPSGLLLAISRKAASRRSTSVQISFFCRQSKLLHCSPVLSGTPWAMLERNCAMRVKYPLGFQCSQLILQKGNLAAQWKGKRKNLCLCQSRNRPSGLKGCLFLWALRMGLREGLSGGVWRGVAWSSFLMGMVERSSYSSKMDSFSSRGEEGAVIDDTFDSFFTIFPKLFQINYIIIEHRLKFQIQGAQSPNKINNKKLKNIHKTQKGASGSIHIPPIVCLVDGLFSGHKICYLIMEMKYKII